MRNYGTPKWVTFLIWMIGTIVVGMLMLVPEAVMYFLYHLIEPASSLERILVFGLFWFGGGGICVLFFFLGVLGFCAWTAAVLD